MKIFLTMLCFCILAICYWVLTDTSIFWKLPKVKEGALEVILWIMCVIFFVISILILWLN